MRHLPGNQTGALFAAAITLALYAPEPAVQRLLQAVAVAALLSSLGLRQLARAARTSWLAGSFGSAAFFALLITLPAFAVDPAIPEPRITPKYYGLLLASALAALTCAFTAARARISVRITIVELLLAVALAWNWVTNPDWLSGPAASWFWISLALALVTLLTRQLASGHDALADPAPSLRSRALGDFYSALWINGVALAILGLRQAFDAGTFRFESGAFKTPVVSTIGLPNGFGAFMAAGMVAAVISAARSRSRLVRVLLGCATLLQFAALLGNGSRGALLSLAAAALAAGWWYRFRGNPRGRERGSGTESAGGLSPPRLRGLAAAVAVLAVLASASALLYRMNPASGQGRLIAWEVSLAMAADHPLTGVGAGRYAAEYGGYQAELWRDPEYARWQRQASDRLHPSSDYIRLAAERGIPGTVLNLLPWAVALGLLLRSLTRPAGRSALEWGVLVLLLAVITHAAVDAAFHWLPTLVMAHLALGLIAAPAVLRIDLQGRNAPLVLMLVACLYAGAVITKTSVEYPAHQQWRRALGRSGEQAIEWLAAARARLPAEPDLDHTLGTALLSAGRPERAVEVLERALHGRDRVETRLALARAQLEMGRLEPAERHARAASTRLPDQVRPQLLLARIHYAANENAQARAALSRCIRRETYFRTATVDAVAARATALWREWYDDEPPR